MKNQFNLNLHFLAFWVCFLVITPNIYCQDNSIKSDSVYRFVDSLASFPGGEKARFDSSDLTVYLNVNYEIAARDREFIIRSITKKNNKYCTTDRLKNGIIVGYSESDTGYRLTNHGLTTHYDFSGKLYSTGHYVNNVLSGQWIYYDKHRDGDTVYYLPLTDEKRYDAGYDNVKLFDEKKSTKVIGQMISDSLNSFIEKNFHLPARVIESYKNFHQPFNCLINTDGRIVTTGMSDWPLHSDIIMEFSRVLGLFVYKTELKEPVRIPATLSISEEFDDTELGEVYTLVEHSPMFIFNGSEMSFQEYITDELIKRNIRCDGMTYVFFVVDKEGKMRNIRILKGFNHCNEYNDVLMDIFNDSVWKPGRQRGKPQSVKMGSVIKFPSDNP